MDNETTIALTMKINASRRKSELKHIEMLYSKFKEAKASLLKGEEEHD